MLFKAHRCRKPVDTYEVAAPMLRTLRTDENSHRSREVKPGEKSIYDKIHDEGTRFTDISQSLFYDEVDALEDEILFPEEYLGEDNYIAVGESTNRLEQLEKFGQLDHMRFALDLDSDENEESIAPKPSEEVSSQEYNDRSYEVGTDPTPFGQEVSLVNEHEELINSGDLSLKTLRHPIATLCVELNIPPDDNFSAAICRELAQADRRYTKTMTIAEKVAFKTIYAQYKLASNIGVGAFNARTAAEMKKQYERFMARESSKCKRYIRDTNAVVLMQCSFQGSLA